MSRLQDEPLEKLMDDKDLSQDMDVYELNEEVWGVLECYNCDYSGKFNGVIPASDKRWINFVCPKCRTIERVRNPEVPN